MQPIKAKHTVVATITFMSKQRILVCPICGETQSESSLCTACGVSLVKDELLIAEGGIGPWWVRDESLPHKPGMTYDHLADLAKRGKIERHTLLRGPTTRQLWMVARRVAGIAHLLERCHDCGAHVSKKDRSCEECGAPFLAYRDRNNLGLDDSDPSQGEVNGMSSFLNDTMILNTTSKPLSMPERKSPEPTEPFEDGVGSPQFRAVQRRLESTLRAKRNLTVVVVVLVLIAIGLGFMAFK